MIVKYFNAACDFLDNKAALTVEAVIGMAMLFAGCWILLIMMMCM